MWSTSAGPLPRLTASWPTCTTTATPPRTWPGARLSTAVTAEDLARLPAPCDAGEVVPGDPLQGRLGQHPVPHLVGGLLHLGLQRGLAPGVVADDAAVALQGPGHHQARGGHAALRQVDAGPDHQPLPLRAEPGLGRLVPGHRVAVAV